MKSWPAVQERLQLTAMLYDTDSNVDFREKMKSQAEDDQDRRVFLEKEMNLCHWKPRN